MKLIMQIIVGVKVLYGLGTLGILHIVLTSTYVLVSYLAYKVYKWYKEPEASLQKRA
jgi:hypothetical protein